jgi:hypothetical protein
MSDIFIEIYLDEDVDVLVAELIRRRGYDATSAVEAGQTGISDPEQLEFATSQRRAIVTHNRGDFAELAREYAAAGREHFGMYLVLRRSPYEVAQHILNILSRVTADEMENQVFYV